MRIARMTGVLIALAAVLVSFTGCTGSDGSWAMPARSGDSAGGTEYAILLYTFEGFGHADGARKAKSAAMELAGWSDVLAVHEAARSKVYWGRFDSVSAAQAKLPEARQWQTPAGNRPFQAACVVPYPGSEPGNPAWKLTNAKGTYTVLIELYYYDPDRGFDDPQAIAALRVAELREEGVEAYYNHGKAYSQITVGAFPDEAIRKRMVDGVEKIVYYSPEMQAVFKQRPYLFHNGLQRQIPASAGVEYIDGKPRLKEGKGRFVTKPTYPVVIPGRGQSLPQDQAFSPYGSFAPGREPRVR